MGMYDTVIVKCKKCSCSVEFQSKAGHCLLAEYTLENAPVEILADLNEERERCDKCGKLHRIRTHTIAFVE